MREAIALGAVVLLALPGCAVSHDVETPGPVSDGVPGNYPATASFADLGEMSGVMILNIWDMPDADESITQLLFQASSGDGSGGSHTVVNAVAIPANALEDLVAGALVPLSSPGTGGPIGYGAIPPGDLPDYSELIWRWPTSIQLVRDEGSCVSVTIALGPRVAADATSTEISTDTSTMRIQGLLAVSCRPESGLEDLAFGSPFCAAILDEAPSLAAFTDVSR